MTPTSIRDIDPVTDLVDRLRLDRNARVRGAFVVEGPTDADIFSRVLDIDRRQFFAANGRANVLRVADSLDHSQLNGLVCIADRDFDDAATANNDLRLVFTDNGDVEAMLTLCPAFVRVLSEWATAIKLSRFGGQQAVRDLLWLTVTPLCVLRSANAARALGLKFDAVPVDEVIARPTLELRLTGYLDRLAQASDSSRTALEALLAETAEPVCPTTGQLLVRGRDVIAVAEVGLTRLYGSLQLQQARGLVEPCLRLAASPGDFDGFSFRQRVEDAIAAAA